MVLHPTCNLQPATWNRYPSTAMNLFEHARQEEIEATQPLAARMRPRTLDEFVGQGHIVGPGRLLRRAIQADQLSSVIFYGPPGTGKTTLARVIANSTKAHFIAINAVLAGVKDIREAIQVAQERRSLYGQRTILFVDEVHRFNKAQQDALLPWVENGTVILIGATTENPYFEVNKALVSRSRIFQLKPLDEDDLRAVARQALADPERGYGHLPVRLDQEALDHLVNVANGDARAVLNALELAVETTLPGSDGSIHITREVAEESIQRRAVLYDKEGDVHFDTISAFIKSLRGSDPDAALYWMAKMVYAGEDARFIFRRMLIFAGEDVGLADPNALRVVVAAAQAFDYVGMPEGRFHLAEAALYLATAPKSNSTMAFFDALSSVEQEREAEVAAHLRDGNRDREGFGHGAGYLYPHAYRDHWVAQQYLPDQLQGKLFYQPSDQGYERAIRERVARLREAQLAAMLEGRAEEPLEILTTGPANRARDRWLQRTLSTAGARLGAVRDRIFEAAHIQRHHVVLDLNVGSGLLTWEAVRRAPEGQVWALAQEQQSAEALRQQATQLPELERPVVLVGEVVELPRLLKDRTVDFGSLGRLPKSEPTLHFDAIVGRNALGRIADKEGALRVLAGLLAADGRLALAEAIPGHSQRLHALLDLSSLPADLGERVVAAETAIYTAVEDPLVNWDAEQLQAAAEAAGLREVSVEVERHAAEQAITPALVDHWFAPAGPEARPSYADHLKKSLSPEEIRAVRALMERQLLGQSVPWETSTAFLVAKR
ncbi:MAG TPA: AAA family ATPase [Ardenticatenaceae bacterium]|nr:AAA family ATPase [Ardenticatenaceae bacterium]